MSDQEFILTLHEDTNANATLFKGREIAFSVAEECIIKKKFASGHPRRAVEMIHDRFGLASSGPDKVLAGNKYHFLPRVLGERMPQGEHDFFSLAQKLYLYYQDRVSRNGILADGVELLGSRLLSRRYRSRVPLYDHHTAHAYSAYLTSTFDEALVVSTDNMGDGFASKVFVGRDGRCEYLYGSTALESPGQFYGEITQVLGFHCMMAGKTTGLASYGDPKPAYPLVKKLFGLSKDRRDFVTPGLLFRNRRAGIYRELGAFKRTDVAAATQERFEEVMVDYVKQALLESGMTRVCLAGGVFANVKLNQRILAIDGVEAVFVHPGMSDLGISMGVGLQFLAEERGLKPFRLDNCYLGPEFSPDEMAAALDEAGLPYVEERDIEARMAELLTEGKVVARYAGRQEYGPRALGNRSVLFPATDPSVNQWLNNRLNRDEFMPFAPATLVEYADDLYVDIHKARESARFMTISFDVTETMRRLSPGAVHIDDTARPQVVSEAESPEYHRLISLYRERTGIPTIINTSFNMHGSPIVCLPEHAASTFQASGIDFMCMGNFLVSKDEAP